MDDRAGEGDPLLFPAAELVGTVAGTLFESDTADGLLGHLASFPPVDALKSECDGDVLQGRETGDEVEGLEDKPDGFAPVDGPLLATHGSEVATIDGDGAGTGCVEPSQEVEECRFSGSADAENGQEFAVRDLETNAIEGLDDCRANAISAGEAAGIDQRCLGYWCVHGVSLFARRCCRRSLPSIAAGEKPWNGAVGRDSPFCVSNWWHFSVGLPRIERPGRYGDSDSLPAVAGRKIEDIGDSLGFVSDLIPKRGGWRIR